MSNQPRSRRRRCRQPDTSFACALLVAAAAALATSSTSTIITPVKADTANDNDDEPKLNSITVTYGPHLYHARSGLARPPNIDYTKLTQINYYSFQITSGGLIYEADSNNDPILLFGPHDWNPDEHKKQTTYCHKSSSGETLCGHHHYEEGLLGLAHMNGVKVYAGVGSVSGGKWGVEKVKEEEKIAEVFAQLASSQESRAEVSLTLFFLSV